MEDENCMVTQSPTTTQNKSEPTLSLLLEQATSDTDTVLENTGVVGGESEALNSVIRVSENVGSEGVGEKRRGRPRKYDVDGNLLSPPTVPSSSSFGSSVKRSRGRPRGSGKLQNLASIGGLFAETAGGNFTPHVMIVNTGEDVISKIISFSQEGPRAVCILSATGSVSIVAIRQSNASSGPSGCAIRYEGLYEIISLSGSYVIGGGNRRSGMVSVLLAKPNGKIFGGYIEGSLMAAGPIQLVVGSFKQNISKQIKRKDWTEPSDAPHMSGNSDSERVPQQLPKMLGGEVRCPSPTFGLMQTTNGGVADNVILANQNIQSASLNGVVLDSKEQRMSIDVNSSASQM